MSYEYSEDGLVEAATKEVLEDLGWEVKCAWKKETCENNENHGVRNHFQEMIPDPMIFQGRQLRDNGS